MLINLNWHTNVDLYVSCICNVHVGGDCVIVKSGRRICGTGAALANAPLVQDKSFFEIKIQCGGMNQSCRPG